MMNVFYNDKYYLYFDNYYCYYTSLHNEQDYLYYVIINQ